MVCLPFPPRCRDSGAEGLLSILFIPAFEEDARQFSFRDYLFSSYRALRHRRALYGGGAATHAS